MDGTRELTISRDAASSLLLLETNNDSAGFYIISTAARTEYEQAYLAFKNIYRERHEKWSARSISFVVLKDDAQGVEETDYLHSIEMDPYFCRKYVLRYSRGAGVLEGELRRLPF